MKLKYNILLVYKIQCGRQGFLNLVWQLVLEKKNSEFKPVKLRLKNDLVLHFAYVERLGKYIFITQNDPTLLVRLRKNCRRVIAPWKKGSVLCITLNCIWWWGSNSGDMGSVRYLFIAITLIPNFQTPILGHGANYTRSVPGPQLWHQM